MKKIILGFFQFLLFIAVLFIVPFWKPLGLRWFVTHPTPTDTRFFIADGLVLAVALYIAILVIELLRKRILYSGLLTTLAFVLALVVSYSEEFGFVTKDIFF
jgi:hypothetical protein